MTNEQAKKMLKAKLECLKRETSGTDFDCNNRNCDECSLCYEQGNMGEQKEALDMAIKALEQQPCEDTISRQAAIDMLKNRWKKTRNYEGIGDDIAEECELYLKQVPSAQPTLYGYSIEHLALIAAVMQKEHVTPEKALEYFKDIQRMGQIIIDEQQEIIKRTVEKWMI